MAASETIFKNIKKNLYIYSNTKHIPNCKNLYVNFSSPVYPGSKLGKSYENMKISKCCKSSCTSQLLFKQKNNVN